jgi:hypothetical protein
MATRVYRSVGCLGLEAEGRFPSALPSTAILAGADSAPISAGANRGMPEGSIYLPPESVSSPARSARWEPRRR